MTETVDGVQYVERCCVECGEILSVAMAAVLVADPRTWPQCTTCLTRPAAYPSPIRRCPPRGFGQ